MESAVKAVKHGAFDFVTKPFSVDLMLLTVERALEKQRLEAENRTLRYAVAGKKRLWRHDWTVRSDAEDLSDYRKGGAE